MSTETNQPTILRGAFYGAALATTVLVGVPVALATSAWTISKTRHYLQDSRPVTYAPAAPVLNAING